MIHYTSIDYVGPTTREEFVGTIAMYPVLGSTSIWQNGSVEGADHQSWYRLYVFADRPYDDAPANMLVGTKEWADYLATPPSASGYPSIGTMAAWAGPPDNHNYFHIWKCPRAIGALKITAIRGGAGLEGVVDFHSLSGQVGSFELSTGQWSIRSPGARAQ